MIKFDSSTDGSETRLSVCRWRDSGRGGKDNSDRRPSNGSRHEKSVPEVSIDYSTPIEVKSVTVRVRVRTHPKCRAYQ